jgi:hypothetical protein
MILSNQNVLLSMFADFPRLILFWIWKIWKKAKLNCEMIWKIWKKGKLKCEMIWKIWKKGKSNSEKICFTLEITNKW